MKQTQIRPDDEAQVERWKDAARAAGLTFSEFARRALDEAATTRCKHCGGTGRLSKVKQ